MPAFCIYTGVANTITVIEIRFHNIPIKETIPILGLDMHNKNWLVNLLVAFALTLVCVTGYGQTPTDDLPPDPGALAVSTVQNMKFGAFYLGNAGGTVTIGNNGTRSFTGDIVLLNLGLLFSQAIFDVEAPEGTIISIWNGPDATLTGSNGGTISLHINDSNPVSPFNSTMAPPGTTPVHVGGSVTLPGGGATVPGNYSGSFYITFNIE